MKALRKNALLIKVKSVQDLPKEFQLKTAKKVLSISNLKNYKYNQLRSGQFILVKEVERSNIPMLLEY